ncbi:hypothetical protein Entas_1554 [Enterobacter soli]|nr:hypothetical protein Entas_1554 [Enterobacter soli]
MMICVAVYFDEYIIPARIKLVGFLVRYDLLYTSLRSNNLYLFNIPFRPAATNL